MRNRATRVTARMTPAMIRYEWANPIAAYEAPNTDAKIAMPICLAKLKPSM
jgi:hypothetical protein